MCFPFSDFFFKKIVGDDDDMPDLLDRHILDIDDDDDDDEKKNCFCIPFFGFFKKIVGSDGRTTYYSHKPHGGYYYSFSMEATDFSTERVSSLDPIVNQKKEEDHNDDDDDDDDDDEEEIAIGVTLTCEQLVEQKFDHAAKNGYIIAIDI
jgi:hypothetical protein